MGGSIGVRSKLGVGSTFFFIVPMPIPSISSPSSTPTQPSVFTESTSLTNALTGKSDELLESSVAATDAASKGKKGRAAMRCGRPARALLVDDVTTNRKMVLRCMQQLGFECFEAVHGAEAVAMSESAPRVPCAADDGGRIQAHIVMVWPAAFLGQVEDIPYARHEAVLLGVGLDGGEALGVLAQHQVLEVQPHHYFCFSLKLNSWLNYF